MADLSKKWGGYTVHVIPVEVATGADRGTVGPLEELGALDPTSL